jgi:hypothetical protein
MSKERYNQIIDEVYEYFITKTRGLNLDLAINSELVVIEGPVYNATSRLLTQEEFIHKCKTDKEFSEKWGLKIEERELSSAEMWEWYGKNGGPNGEILFVGMIVYQNEEDNSHIKSWLEKWASNVPTKQITLIYQNEKTEIYE